MKRKIGAACLCAILALALTACHSSKALTYQVESGDAIEVTLDTTDGYDLVSEDAVISVQKDGETVLQGVFLTDEMFEANVKAIESTDGVTMLETREDPAYRFFQYEGQAGTETTFLMKIDGSNTGALFASLQPREEAEAAFARLTLEAAE